MKEIVENLVEHLGYLYDRWQDEKEYEDFSLYIENVKNTVEQNGVEFISLKKRPFEVHIKKGEKEGMIKVTAKAISFTEFTKGAK
jgi:hypothetical protein|tara:strand:+ start:324 stop:578 length:255 start_codon:yes stop_codon:yes gene_type:complete